ncbi:hypothetical protein M758_10G025200 [Ceratodon purpureus]|nr:hypothetical protein M758_10G025200 [Ceratodon purpureus]
MNALREDYILMEVANMPKMEGAEKPKGRLFAAVLPSVWFLKLRSFRRKSRSLRGSDISEPVIPDSAPFLPKTVQNVYRHGSEICTFSPLQGLDKSGSNPVSPMPENAVANGAQVSVTPSRKSTLGTEATTRTTPVTSSIATTTASGSSNFSRCMYRSTFFSNLKNLCKLVGDESLSTKSSSQSIQFRRSATPSMRAWFLVGCGGTSRPRTRHSSLDLERESGLMEMDADSGLECIDEGTGVEASWPKKSESWSGANTTSWNVDSSNEEVVKNQVIVVKKKKFAKNRELKGVKVKSPIKLKPGSKPTLGHLFSTRSDTDSPRKVFPDMETESEIHIDNPKMVRLPWKSTSFGSDSTFRVPSMGSDYGLALAERKPYFGFSESETPGVYSEEPENGGNVSDSQSLLREKVLAAERMREGSKSWRDQQKLETKRNDAEAMKLLASLDQALDQRNLKRLVEDEEDTSSVFGSPRFELHNSPVFESFLESSAKAWGIEIPPPKTDESKNSGSISDQSRELHCVTVHTAPQPEKGRDQGQERDQRGRETARAVRVNSASPAKARKVKRPVEKEVQKKPSPSRKPLPKSTREERTIHPQREESMVDPELHDEFNQARKKFNEARKRAKQRRSKQVASVPSPSPAPAPAPKQQAPAAKPQAPPPKERVAVVVESSYDPYNDFRQSMIEMIVDQDIHETGDLEELLQCYLSLNEPEYHNVIVDVFTDVWHELFESNS